MRPFSFGLLINQKKKKKTDLEQYGFKRKNVKVESITDKKPTSLDQNSSQFVESQNFIQEKPTKDEEEHGLRKKKRRRDGEEEVGFESSVPSVGVVRGRVFTEEDEIVILEALVNYANSKNFPLPLATTMKGFHGFVKEKLHVDSFTKNQISDKIRRLKVKFFKNFGMMKGDDPIFANAHDSEVYRISKKIWGSVSDVRTEDVIDEGEQQKCEEGDQNDFWSKFPVLKDSLEWKDTEISSMLDKMKENMPSIASAKATQLEREWMDLCLKDSEISLMKLHLKMEIIRLTMDAIKGRQSSAM